MSLCGFSMYINLTSIYSFIIMSLIVVNMEEELPSYCDRPDRLPSYSDRLPSYIELYERYIERTRCTEPLSLELCFLCA